MEKDYYQILGVEKNASADELKTAYRKLVKQYHPDLHPGDEKAAEKIKEINEAYGVLSDPQKRQQYDFELEHPGASQGGFGGFGGGEFTGDLNDIFSSFFGGGFGGSQRQQSMKEKGEDMVVTLELSFLDAAKGCKKTVTFNHKETCEACKGTGAKDGTKYQKCQRCNGSGKIQYSVGGGFFRMVNTGVCPDCGGKGKKIIEKCSVCGGKGYDVKKVTLELNIPAGADNDSYIVKRGYGHASTVGGEPGNLIVRFKVAKHPLFVRKDFDLFVDLPISYETACLGGKVMIPTLDNAMEIDIPEGTQTGKVITLRGKGIRSGMNVGSIYVNVLVETPTRLSKEQKELLKKSEELKDLKNYKFMNNYKQTLESLYGVDPYKK